MNTPNMCLLLIAATILISFAGIPAMAQPVMEGQGMRSFKSEDFTKDRPKATSAPTPDSKPGPGKVYHLKTKVPAPNKSPGLPLPRPEPESREQMIGVTLWRLRPAAASEAEPQLTVTEASGAPVKMTPVRVGADTVLRTGDRVRLTIESPRKGYLYVIDQERFANGSLGEASMIFPTKTTRGGENQVQAGILIDLPAWQDRTPYWLIESLRPGYVGDVITVLVTDQPLPEFTPAPKPRLVSMGQLKMWEEQWGGEMEVYNLGDGVGAPLTGAELAAAKPGMRALTQADPAPQILYRVKTGKGAPVFIRFQVRVEQNQ